MALNEDSTFIYYTNGTDYQLVEISGITVLTTTIINNYKPSGYQLSSIDIGNEITEISDFCFRYIEE
jgi:hypothetical protein